MKKWIFIFAWASTFCFSEPETPCNYKLVTSLEATSKNSFHFSAKQQIEFECRIDEISPIDALPKQITLTFKRIMGDAEYGNRKVFFDTEQKNIYSLEFETIKKLLNSPIPISLNSDLKMAKKSQQFDQLLEIASIKNSYVNEQLLEQIIEIIFSPSCSAQNQYHTNIFFPFKAQLTLNFKQSLSGSIKEAKCNEPINIEGIFDSTLTPNTIQLAGHANVDINWSEKDYLARHYRSSYTLEEKNSLTLFDQELTFNHTLFLEQDQDPHS